MNILKVIIPKIKASSGYFLLSSDKLFCHIIDISNDVVIFFINYNNSGWNNGIVDENKSFNLF